MAMTGLEVMSHADSDCLRCNGLDPLQPLITQLVNTCNRHPVNCPTPQRLLRIDLRHPPETRQLAALDNLLAPPIALLDVQKETKKVGPWSQNPYS